MVARTTLLLVRECQTLALHGQVKLLWETGYNGIEIRGSEIADELVREGPKKTAEPRGSSKSISCCEKICFFPGEFSKVDQSQPTMLD